MKTSKLLPILAAGLAVGLLAAGSALAAGGRGVLYQFRGHLLAAPGADASSLRLSVEGGNHRALRAMLGSSVDQTFATGDRTEFLRWSNGLPAVVGSDALAAGDWVNVNVRAPRGASLDAILAAAAGTVGDRGAEPTRPDRPLYLFRGKIVSFSSGSVTVEVRGGNRRALRLLVAQPSTQTFATGDETIVLRWQGKVPTVISTSELTAGDRVVVRVRAAARSTLAQVAATPANRVAEHERRAAS